MQYYYFSRTQARHQIESRLSKLYVIVKGEKKLFTTLADRPLDASHVYFNDSKLVASGEYLAHERDPALLCYEDLVPVDFLQYYNVLPPDIREKAIVNYVNDEDRRRSMPASSIGSLYEAIDGGFVWLETPEGHGFWRLVAYGKYGTAKAAITKEAAKKTIDNLCAALSHTGVTEGKQNKQTILRGLQAFYNQPANRHTRVWGIVCPTNHNWELIKGKVWEFHEEGTISNYDETYFLEPFRGHGASFWRAVSRINSPQHFTDAGLTAAGRNYIKQLLARWQ